MMKSNHSKIIQKYIEVSVKQVPKKKNVVCGDFFMCERNYTSTTFILCDGMGSGYQAHIWASMCASRIYHSLSRGMSLKDVCNNVVSSMHEARTKEASFSAFAIVKIFNDGHFTIMSYEMPKMTIIENNYCYVLEPRYYKMGHEVVSEVNGFLNDGDTLIIYTDGVSQAGLGISYPFGWTSEGIASYTNQLLEEGLDTSAVLSKVLEKVYLLSDNICEDDTSIASLSCRTANSINILSGPPSSKNLDEKIISDFLMQDGLKVICGSSTADMVSRETGKKLHIEKIPAHLAEPPLYMMEGFDIVTEGVLTLNQLYNLLEDESYDFENISAVTELYFMLKKVDIVRFFIGTAKNVAHTGSIFKQLRIINRQKIVMLLSEKLKKEGKLVVIENY